VNCEWCGSKEIEESENTVYWELPDGSGAITITNTPCIICLACEMNYQQESIIELIEEQLILIDTGKLNSVLTYQQLMGTPKWLKRNYFNFDK
jgi:uncharacterized YokU family protein